MTFVRHCTAAICFAAFVCAAAAAAPKPPTARTVPREIALPERFRSGGAGLTFSADGAALLCFGGKGIAAWDIARGEVVSHIDTNDWPFVLSPDGTRIANGSDRSIRLHDAKMGELLHTLEPPLTNAPPAPGAELPFFRANGFDERARHFFTTTPDGIQVWDVASGKMIRRIQRKDPPHNNGSVQSRDGRWLTFAFPSGGAEVLDTRTGQFVSITAKEVFALVPRDGRRFAMVSLGSWSFAGNSRAIYGTDQMNGLLLAWSLPDGKLRSHVEIPGMIFATVSPDGSRILARYREPDDRILRVLDGRTRRVLAELGPLKDTVAWYAISPDNRYVAATSVGDTRLWDFAPDADLERPATGPATRRPRDHR